MNTTKIYDAQLNVFKKYYTKENINTLIENLNVFDGGEIYYNDTSRTIDIKLNRLSTEDDDSTIKTILYDWLSSLEVDLNDLEDLNIILENFNYMLNITKLTYPNIEDIEFIKIYLY